MRGLPTLAAGIFTLVAFVLGFPQPEQIYGVNLGSWYVLESPPVYRGRSLTPRRLLTEPWMLPDGSFLARFTNPQHQKMIPTRMGPHGW